MAFSNIRSIPLGGGLRIIIGDFTASIGGGSQTIGVGSGRVIPLKIAPQVTSEPVDFNTELGSVSVSGAINTLTIYGNSAITAGTFVLLADNGS